MTTVLVVDDEPDFTWVVETLLQDEGYDVRTAENGRVALLLMQDQAVHLVLCDIHMPILDGIALRKQVEQAGLGAIPFVYMSSIPRETAGRLLEPADPFIQKPFTIEDLTDLIGRFVSPT